MEAVRILVLSYSATCGVYPGRPTPPLVEEETHFQTHNRSWNEKNLAMDPDGALNQE
jgi:hypothetical protein